MRLVISESSCVRARPSVCARVRAAPSEPIHARATTNGPRVTAPVIFDGVRGTGGAQVCRGWAWLGLVRR
jgi:hypothetical protein